MTVRTTSSFLVRMCLALVGLLAVATGFVAGVWFVFAVVLRLFENPFANRIAGAIALGFVGWLVLVEVRGVRAVERSVDATPTTADDYPILHARTPESPRRSTWRCRR